VRLHGGQQLASTIQVTAPNQVGIGGAEDGGQVNHRRDVFNGRGERGRVKQIADHCRYPSRGGLRVAHQDAAVVPRGYQARQQPGPDQTGYPGQ
jgi:hypothetical protein